MRIDHYDCRTGGSYRYLHVSEGNEFGFHGSFHEVRPSEVIVQTFAFEGFPDSVALERLVLEDLGNRRTRLTATSLVDSFEARDAFVAMDDEGYARLDDSPLTHQAPAVSTRSSSLLRRALALSVESRGARSARTRSHETGSIRRTARRAIRPTARQAGGPQPAP